MVTILGSGGREVSLEDTQSLHYCQAWVNILPSNPNLTNQGKSLIYNKKNAKFKLNFVKKSMKNGFADAYFAEFTRKSLSFHPPPPPWASGRIFTHAFLEDCEVGLALNAATKAEHD